MTNKQMQDGARLVLAHAVSGGHAITASRRRRL